MTMKTKRRNHGGLGWLTSISGLVLVGLAACQPGEADETTSDGSTGTDGSGTDASSTEGSSTSGGDAADTTDGSSTSASSTPGSGTGSSTTESDPFCGDGIVLGIEDCDGEDLRGETCESLGFVGGTLACDADCMYDWSGCVAPPEAPSLTLGFSAIKQLEFGWAAVDGADHYELEESAAPGEPFVQIAGGIEGESISLTMPLHLRHQASYRLRACNVAGCTASTEVAVMSSLAEAVGYFKASNTDVMDHFGMSIALSGDGSTMAIGAPSEDSSATGIGGNEANDTAPDAGAVYVFVRDAAGAWSQQAYVKASNTDADDGFGVSVALSVDGSTLAVGAPGESSSAVGIGGDQADDSAPEAGATYVFVRDAAGAWSQQAYIKASNTDADDGFGVNVVIGDDGNTLAVAAIDESSNANGVDGDQADDSAPEAGATYVFVRDAMGQWSQQAYLKASNSGASDWFGMGLAMSTDGNTLVVGAPSEDSSATGIGGNQASESASFAGAAYVFVRNAMGQWSQQAYVKASNTDPGDHFGYRVALGSDGDTLAITATHENSSATGIDGNQLDDSLSSAGAVYVFVRNAADQWSQQAYVKASNTDVGDGFGDAVALSGDGDVLAVGARAESSSAIGIGGDQADDSLQSAGAVYVFVRDAADQWSQRAYVKASNPDASDRFGMNVALTGDGGTLAVMAFGEASSATGIGGDQNDDSAGYSGAVYLF